MPQSNSFWDEYAPWVAAGLALAGGTYLHIAFRNLARKK